LRSASARYWTRRERAGERLDAAARDVDHRDRGHPHHRALEQLLSDRAVAVLGATDAERAADVVAAGVASGGLLRERLQRGVDRDVDRIADVDRRAVEDDVVARADAAGVHARSDFLVAGVGAVERARRLAQRLERRQQREERRRHAPARVVDRRVGAGLACDRDRRGSACGDRDAAHRRHRADALLRAARRREEVARSGVALAAEVDATRNASPGIAPRHLARGDLHLLLGAPARERRFAFGAAPGQRLEDRRVAPVQRLERGNEVGAAHLEAPAGCVGGLDRRRERVDRGGEPAHGIEADTVLDARVGAAAEAQQRGVDLVHLRRDLLGSARLGARAGELAQPARERRRSAPLLATRRHAGEDAERVGAGRDERAALDDRALERLQRGDAADADVAVAAPLGVDAVGIGGTDDRDERDDAEQHRNDAEAGGDRAFEERDAPALSHRASDRRQPARRRRSGTRRGTRC
jgi:hypothetical protein